MAFTGNYVSSSFKQGLLSGKHDFTTVTGDVFKLALYPNTVTFNADTSAYTSVGEVSNVGTGYTTGGNALTIAAEMPRQLGATAIADFEDIIWPASSITARGGILYNATATGGGNPAVLILDFLANKVSTVGDFTVVFPGATAASAVIRIG